MIRRLLPIAFLTGAGQLFSIFAIKSIAAASTVFAFSGFMQADAFFQLLLSIIAFGLQPMAMRELVLSTEWEKHLQRYQSARMCMAILLLPVCLLAFWKQAYVVFLIAPLLAANADYAIYARGYPIFGAFVAFLRLVIPYGITLFIAHTAPDKVLYAFVASLMPVFFVTDWLIFRRLSVKTEIIAKWQDLLLYVKSLLLGLVVLGQYFIGLGLMLMVPFCLTEPASQAVFVGLKFYMIYKGVIRIITQAYLREMLIPRVALVVDQLSMLVAALFCSCLVFFPEASIRLFFGERFLSFKLFYQLLGGAALIYAFINSRSTMLMLEKKDRLLAAVTMGGAGTMFLTLLSVALLVRGDAWVAGVSLVVGEAVLAAALLISSRPVQFGKHRLGYLLELLGIMLIPFLISHFAGDELWLMILASTVVGIICGIIYGKKFLTSPVP